MVKTFKLPFRGLVVVQRFSDFFSLGFRILGRLNTQVPAWARVGRFACDLTSHALRLCSKAY